MLGRHFNNSDALEIQRHINDAGSDATLVQNTGSTPIDPAKPWLGNTKSETSADGIAIITRVSKRYVDGQTVLSTDRMALFSPKDIAVEPIQDDHFEQSGIRYSVVLARPFNPGGTPLLWRVILRR